MYNLHYEQFPDGTVKCIEDEIPFDVPDGWAWTSINNIAFVTKLAGFEYTKNIAPNLCETGIPLFKGKNVQDSKIIYEFESYIPESVSDGLLRSQINRKCILTPYVGTIGNIGIHNKPGKFHLGSNVGKIELFNMSAGLMEEYVVTYLKSSFGFKQLTKHMKATAQASISIEAIRDVYIPIPPEKEQQRLWLSLSEILKQIENINTLGIDFSNMIATAKSKILDLAIRGKLVPQNPDDEPASVLLERIRAEKEELIKQGKIKRDKKESVIFKGEDNSYYENLPINWITTTLGAISSLVTKGTTPRGGNVAYSDSGIGFLRAENISGYDKLSLQNLKYVDEEIHNNFLKRSILQNNDILITIAGSLGRTAVVTDADLPLNTNQAVAIVRLVNSELIYNRYITYALNANKIQKALLKQEVAMAIPNLSLENISDCSVPIPPLNEQYVIVRVIDEIFETLDKIEQSLN